MRSDPPEKIDIDPSGIEEGLIPFVVFAIVGFIFVYWISPVFIVQAIIPTTLIMLIALCHLVLLGDNWPWAPPGANWTPTQSRLISGIGMTIVWITLTLAILLFMRFIYPRWPIGTLYLWFGVIGFWATLLYGVNWRGWPLKGKVHPLGTVAISFTIVMIVSILIWNFLTNLDGTALAGSPINHKGPLNVNWLIGYLVWAIAWFLVFSPVFTTQGWPFSKWGHPRAAIGQTILAHILGYIFWRGSLSLGLSPNFSFAAVGSSLIFWSLVHSWHLQLWGVTNKCNQFKSALSAFVLQCHIIAVWILVLKLILGPKGNAITAAKLPVDVNTLIIYLNICVLAPALIAHNAFWLRWPLTLPTPLGTPPFDQCVRK